MKEGMNIATVTHNEFSFVDVHDPQELEVKEMLKEYEFSAQDLDDYLNRKQMSKIEVNEKYTLIVLDFPHLEGTHRPKDDEHVTNKSVIQKAKEQLPLPSFSAPIPHKQLRAGHINFFIGKNFLVVLHSDRTPEIDKIFADCQKALHFREEYLSHGPTYLLYRLVDALCDQSLKIVLDISATIEHLDKEMTENRASTIVEEISMTRRNIVVFHTIMKQIMPLFGDLRNNKIPELTGTFIRWNHITNKLQKAFDRIEDNKELINGLAISYESLLTARTNEIIKVLTMFTAILLPLTLLASMYGMNIVGLPYAHDANALWIITDVMVVMALIMIFFFKAKRWL